jgi:xylan 1,4-beta-xylosidase
MRECGTSATRQWLQRGNEALRHVGNNAMRHWRPALAGLVSAIAIGILTEAGLPASTQASPVAIHVDTRHAIGDMTPLWARFGNDEPNYTYTPEGRTLLSELAAASPTPVFIRVHNLLTSGDGTPALKWGSTNAYTEDAAGRPHYDWTIVDRIFDTWHSRGMKPIVQLGFMPEALSSHPEPYRHFWKPGDNYNDIYTGWAYPPVDYGKWRELAFQLTDHLVHRYGRREVESWWFEVWNEPDIGYWKGTAEEYWKLYDYAADGVKRALPTARIGGPETTGPNSPRAREYLRRFLDHVLHGTNAATGRTGVPLDLVTFHAKGAPRVMPDGHVRMSVMAQLDAIDEGLDTIESFPELASTPVIIGESDPEGCAACPVRTNPANTYRNGTMYSSYTAEQIARTYALADRHHANIVAAVTWAFLFEGQPPFDGFRDLATNGIDKPVLNVFRMLGHMTGQRVDVTSTGGIDLDDVLAHSVRGAADISALATRSSRSAAVMVWNYHDDDLPGPEARIALSVTGLPAGRRLTLTHYRVDQTHSNAYTKWQEMGSPKIPTQAQQSALERAGQLERFEPDRTITSSTDDVELTLSLPRQGVSLLLLAW